MSNQLELFPVLSKDQLQAINDYTETKRKESLRKTESVKNTVALLIEGGFVEGKDYEVTHKTKDVTKEVTLGRYSDPFVAEVSFTENYGNVFIKYSYYSSDSHTLIKTSSTVRAEYKKLECSCITPQYRAYLPSSLFQKLIEKNQKAQDEFDRADVDKQIMSYTISKYEKLYPNACITPSTDYTNYSGKYTQYNTVLIEFKSGSTVSLRLGYHKDAEYVSKSVDAVVKNFKMVSQLCNHFNNQ